MEILCDFKMLHVHRELNLDEFHKQMKLHSSTTRKDTFAWKKR